ncbi:MULTISPECIES: CrcB family protein [Lactobacillus]|uniref:Fluoride-specific ion channel FluC n=1 Tax=Lactobacillus xujianguonis TaxID=2495899 RepID=A0A437SX73_9LACO|nr:MULTISPECIES: CrcB family protein [Lactobacillus]RVU71521.1 CrcB family protein [Lactobacillus xujianguonis]RVU76708.1 CrcB family protein [Lactobacillus xujianguonis]
MSDKVKNYLSVGFFAFFGGALRCYLNNIWAQSGTFFANVTGCFLLAFLTYFFLEYREGRDWLATGLSTGFVGAYTTLSSFKLDTLKQLLEASYLPAVTYFLSSIVFGLLFAALGMLVGKKVGQFFTRKA